MSKLETPPSVAILCLAEVPPAKNGIIKPMKPGDLLINMLRQRWTLLKLPHTFAS